MLLNSTKKLKWNAGQYQLYTGEMRLMMIMDLFLTLRDAKRFVQVLGLTAMFRTHTKAMNTKTTLDHSSAHPGSKTA